MGSGGENLWVEPMGSGGENLWVVGERNYG